jgi:serine/threonine protein kinase
MGLRSDELRGKLEVDSPASLLDLIMKCMDVDPHRRPTAKQLLRSPFFTLSPQVQTRATNLVFSLIRKPPISVFVDSVFGTLFRSIEAERKINPINVPSLDTAADVLNYFLNKDSSGVSISFPIEDASFPEIVDEIFVQNIFDGIVDFVIDRLHVRFEFEDEIAEDRPFSSFGTYTKNS